jgi:hypothetical protein
MVGSLEMRLLFSDLRFVPGLLSPGKCDGLKMQKGAHIVETLVTAAAIYLL